MKELKRGEAKRLALMQATAALIGEKGLAAITTREIAERAGSTERTLFKQFGNKEGLLTAVLDMAARAQMAQSRFPELASNPPRTLDQFEAWHIRLMAERVQTVPKQAEVGRLFLLEIIQNDVFRARYRPNFVAGVWQPLIACFDALKAAGEIDRSTPSYLLAQCLASLNLGYLVARMNVAPDYAWDTERDIAGIAALFRRAIEPRQ